MCHAHFSYAMTQKCITLQFQFIDKDIAFLQAKALIFGTYIIKKLTLLIFDAYIILKC